MHLSFEYSHRISSSLYRNSAAAIIVFYCNLRVNHVVEVGCASGKRQFASTHISHCSKTNLTTNSAWQSSPIKLFHPFTNQWANGSKSLSQKENKLESERISTMQTLHTQTTHSTSWYYCKTTSAPTSVMMVVPPFHNHNCKGVVNYTTRGSAKKRHLCRSNHCRRRLTVRATAAPIIAFILLRRITADKELKDSRLQ